MLFFSYDIVLIVYFLCYAVVNVQSDLYRRSWDFTAFAVKHPPTGGLKWTRTTDLTLIRRVL